MLIEAAVETAIFLPAVIGGIWILGRILEKLFLALGVG